MKLFVVHIFQQYAKQFLVKFLYPYSSSSLTRKVSIYCERYYNYAIKTIVILH